VRLNEIAAEFAGRVPVFCIYIREAHPDDGWQVEMNVDDDVVFNEPTTADERAEMAQTCMLRLNLAMPMLLDDMTNAVDAAYVALPERLYVLDRDHRVAWRSVSGPAGFKPEDWREQLRKVAG
jgi:hypothetical protein